MNHCMLPKIHGLTAAVVRLHFAAASFQQPCRLQIFNDFLARLGNVNAVIEPALHNVPFSAIASIASSLWRYVRSSLVAECTPSPRGTELLVHVGVGNHFTLRLNNGTETLLPLGMPFVLRVHEHRHARVAAPVAWLQSANTAFSWDCVVQRGFLITSSVSALAIALRQYVQIARSVSRDTLCFRTFRRASAARGGVSCEFVRYSSFQSGGIPGAPSGSSSP